MGLKTGTICSKHEEIKDLADRIMDLAGHCLDDGQRMENGLDEKGERIKELEKELEEKNEYIASLEKQVEDLQEELQGLVAEIKTEGGRE